jgi:hypothetical protein
MIVGATPMLSHALHVRRLGTHNTGSLMMLGSRRALAPVRSLH